MNSVVGHFVILATTGGAICVMSYAVGWPRVMPRSEPAVSAVAQRPVEADSPTPSARVQEVPVPRDIASLTREIQRELKRLGCYDGEANGRWNAQSRLAMQAFVDRVNAKLPVERPDYVLLRLAQGHQGTACGPTASAPSPPALLREGRVPPAGTQPN
jgi:Putative peptidoglycan binding domain